MDGPLAIRRRRWTRIAALLAAACGAAGIAWLLVDRAPVRVDAEVLSESAARGAQAPRGIDGPGVLAAKPGTPAHAEIAAEPADAVATATPAVDAPPSTPQRTIPARVDVVDAETGRPVAGARWRFETDGIEPDEWRASGETKPLRVAVALEPIEVGIVVVPPAGWALWERAPKTVKLSGVASSLWIVQPLRREAKVTLTALDSNGKPIEGGLGVHVSGLAIEGVRQEATERPGVTRLRGVPWVSGAGILVELTATFHANGANDSTDRVLGDVPVFSFTYRAHSAQGLIALDVRDDTELTVPVPNAAGDTPGSPNVKGFLTLIADSHSIQFGVATSVRFIAGGNGAIHPFEIQFTDAQLPPRPLVGRVRAEIRRADGRAAAGIPCRVSDSVAVTDTNGVATIDDLPVGHYPLTSDDPAIRLEESTIDVVADVETVVVVRERPGATLDVTVVNERGLPWPTARIVIRPGVPQSLADLDEDGVQRVDFFTDAYGARTIHSVEPGEFIVTAFVPGIDAERSANEVVVVASGQHVPVRFVVPTVEPAAPPAKDGDPAASGR
jgi:hypothetical protein